MRPLARSGLMTILVLAWAGPSGRLVREGTGGGESLLVAGVGLPNGVSARPDEANPVIRGKNVYAANLVRNGGAWNLYYGGWRDAADANDRIYAAVSIGAMPSGPWQGQQVIIDNGEYVHVNDPSVQRRAPDDWYMAFTTADKADGRDWIAVAASPDGLTFTPRIATREAEIRISGAEFTHMARPSLLWTGTVWKLWFDGKIKGGGRHSYLAECSEPFPKRFRFVHEYPDVNGFPGFFEPDVALVGGTFVAVVQRNFTNYIKLESRDGVHFEEAGVILSAGDPAVAKKRISNPGWIGDAANGRILGVAISMTDELNLTGHVIGLAYHQYLVQVTTPSGVTHQYGRSRGFDVAVPMTFGAREFSRIRVEDPRTHATIADQAVSARSGDRWRLVREAPPPPVPMGP
ncbi:MAG: hypothetical protein JWN86_2273 [Planctomycetota bacterium]|nr:hypothetical protein [Planctomycetota bacterium]